MSLSSAAPAIDKKFRTKSSAPIYGTSVRNFQPEGSLKRRAARPRTERGAELPRIRRGSRADLGADLARIFLEFDL
jgi:hypothetical protein